MLQIRGLGLIAAIGVLSEIGDIARFTNSKQLVSYAGLATSVRQSGPKEAFLLWMEEAHQHESFASYVMSLKNQPIEQHPMQRLPRQVEESARQAF